MKEIPATREANWNKTDVTIALVLALVTLGLYGPVLGHAFIDFDDDLYVTANPMVQQGWTWHVLAWAWTTGHASNWHPLTWLSHITDCSLFGLEPAGHHAISALLHTANTLLLFLLLRWMTGAVWRAAIVAALFGWHPLHVESVAWVAERKDVLSTFFFLLAIWAYLRYAEEFNPPSPRLWRARVQGSKFKVFYGLSLLLFACGLMSKPMVVTLPFVLLLLDYWPLERFGPGVGARLVVEKLPFLALSAADCVVTYFAQKSGGAVSDAMPFFLRALNAVLSYGRYLGRMFWPAKLAVIYPYSTTVPMDELCACVLLLVALTWLALKCRQRKYLVTGWFWYLGTLAPVIGFVQAGPQSSADRFTYIPLIGIFMMIVWGVADLAGKWRLPTWAPTLAAALVLAACAAGTELQLSYWSDSGTLFNHALAVTQDNFLAWNNLGSHLLRQGKAEEALRCFTISLQERERPVNLRNAGMALEALHRASAAAAFFGKALAMDPHYIPARMSLADSLADSGRNDEAAGEYRKVLQLDPGYADAHCNLACALAAQGKTAEAMTELQEALRLSPSDASTHCNLGNLLMEQGKLDEAADEYRAALRSKPRSPEIHANLGAVLALQGRRQEAMDEFNEALRLAPNFTQAKERLKALTGKN
jgi:tetratricopeptide (TPR) repeat protein